MVLRNEYWSESKSSVSLSLTGSGKGDFATLVDILRWRACERPERRTCTFLVDGERREESVTDGELDARARAVACALRERGLRGERVLLLHPPGIELITALFGCLYAGAVAVPAYPPDPGRLDRTLPRLLSMVDDARPGALLTTSELAEYSGPAFAAVPRLGALPRLTTDGVDPAGAAAWRDPGPRPDDLALLQYTSGSTKAPRGVMLTHANLTHNLECDRTYLGITPESHAVIWLPPYHDMGLIAGIFEWFYAGTTATLMSPLAFLQRPARWLRAVSRTRASLSGGPNFAYDLCTRKISPDEIAGVDLSTWTFAWNGAETVRPETLARFAGKFRSHGFRAEAFRPCYGLAEATLMVSGWAPRAAGDRIPVAPGGFMSCGRPVGGQRVVIVDPELRTPRAPGEVGEIWVAGPSVADGYWGRPEETAATFGATLADGDGPFLRTGDLGFLRAGELYVTCRMKDLIIVRGRNIHPQDVELTAETSHPALRPGSGAAFGVDLDGAERLVVVQEMRPDRAGTPAEAADAIRRAVAAAHDVRPYAVVLIEPRSVPKTSSGKIQRGRTRDAYLAGTLPVLTELRDTAGPERSVAPVVPGRERMSRQAIEDWLVTETAREAGVAPERIDVAAPFTDHGLDSVQGVALAGGLGTLLGIELPETLVWDHPSIAALAEHLALLAADLPGRCPPSSGALGS
ncbi:AMP-binding protein [Streptomyces sp. NPDC059063]|uniref:AMP-binding protein n=1 Tax=unclassified Streptomyces TaxID=2593676 RepID=UPI00369CA01D